MKGFEEILRTSLKNRNWSKSDLARAVGVSRTFPTNVSNGHCPMPLDRVEEWAQALRLDAGERAEFYLAASLTHLPQEMREQMRKTIDQRVSDGVTAYRAADPEVTALKDRVTQLTKQLNQVRAAIGQPPLTEEK